jgi:hypothetical protein
MQIGFVQGYSASSRASQIQQPIKLSQLSPSAIHASHQFKANPAEFLRNNMVDTSKVVQAGDTSGMADMINQHKFGHFALVPDQHDPKKYYLTPVMGVATAQDQHSVISAHWIPYSNGHGTPGHADIFKQPNGTNNSAPFVFTPGMNGCSLEVTQHPHYGNQIRVFHNQHPGAARVEAEIDRHSAGRLDAFTSGEYLNNPNPAQHLPVAMNMMHFSQTQQSWQFISQSQGQKTQGAGLNGELTKIPNTPVIVRPTHT